MEESYVLEKFRKDDAELNNIRTLSNNLFEKGLIAEEVKNRVLESQEYKTWNSEDRSIFVDFLDNETYEFFKREYKRQIYFEKIDNFSRKYYNLFLNNIEIKVELKNNEENIYFKELGIDINNEQLVSEVMFFSNKLNLKVPMSIRLFYDIVGNTFVGANSNLLFYYPEIWDEMSDKPDDVYEFMIAFLKKYQVDDMSFEYE